MTGEEMERAIAFVLEQQARFEVQMAALVERQVNSEARIARLEGGLGLMREAVVGAMGLAQRVTEAQIETDKKLAALTVRMDALAERVDGIGERLDAFIVVVERYITGRNGQGH